jgi:hypothetical protein
MTASIGDIEAANLAAKRYKLDANIGQAVITMAISPECGARREKRNLLLKAAF